MPCWSENKKSWFLLTKHNHDKTSWSEAKWFPKSKCTLKQTDNKSIGIITMPLWLHKKMFKK